MDSLNILLHRLPQELYDHIYDEVFTAPSTRIDISRNYSELHLLSVSRVSREQFAKSYYQNTIFVVDHDKDLHLWLRAVAGSGHLQLLQEVRFVNRSLLDPGVSRLQGPLDGSHLYRRIAAEQHAVLVLARLQRNLKGDGLELPQNVLKLEQHFVNDLGEQDLLIVC